jgi:multiple sugar transport system permease protein
MAIRADEIPVSRGRPRGTARVSGWLDRERILGPVFVTPALLLLLLLVAYPFVMAVYFSLSNAFIGRPSHFIGITNFVRLWDSDAFRQTFQNAFVFTGVAVLFKVLMGIALALLLNEQLWFKRMIRGAVLLPWVIPTALSTLGWWWMFNSLYSVVNWTGIALGIMDPPGPNWLGQRYYAMAAVITVNIWLRGGRGGWRRRQRPFLAHHTALAQAGARCRRALLHHLHVQRFQHRLRADPRRTH